MDAPISYKDPEYTKLERRIEGSVGIPEGLLSAIRLKGEKSNADQVSSAGARSVYQITPSTRNLVLRKYGVDAFLSPHNAAMTAALLLKESKDRNGGDIASAVKEYIGGTDPTNHGPETKSYVKRVMNAFDPISTANAGDELPPEAVAAFDKWAASQKESQDQQPQQPAQPQYLTPEEIDAYNKWEASQKAQPEQPAPEQAQSEQDPNMLTAIGNGVFNLPESVVKMGSGLVDAGMHPIDTAKNIGKLGIGAIQSALPPIVPYDQTPFGDQRAFAKPVIDDYMKTYGSMKEFKNAIANDPARVLSDLSMLTGIASKAPGLAGNAAEAVSSIVDPISNTAKLADKLGEVPKVALGRLAGTGTRSVDEAIKAGEKGGTAAKAFLGAANEGHDIADVLPVVKKALNNMRDERALNYQTAMQSVNESRKPINVQKIEDAVKAATLGKYKDYVFNPKSAGIQQEILDEVQKFKSLPYSEYHIPEGVDKLKRAIGEIRDSTEFHSPARVVADRAYHAIKDAIIKQAPEYGKAMADYEKMSKELNEIEKTFSLGEKSSVDSAIRKLQSTLRNDANTNYGNRGKLMDELSRHGAQDVLPSLAGQTMNTWTPRGLQSVVPSATAGAALFHPSALLSLPLQSPRVVGNIGYGYGVAKGAIKSAIPDMTPLQSRILTNSAARFNGLNQQDEQQ